METTQQKPNLRQLISKASTLKRPTEFLTEREEEKYLDNKYYDGVIKLKDKLLGRSKKSLKTLEEISTALVNLKIASSLSEAEDLIVQETIRLGYAAFQYTPTLKIDGKHNQQKYLEIIPAKNESGETKYRIELGVF